jgi:iron complex outermembrane recepter protein
MTAMLTFLLLLTASATMAQSLNKITGLVQETGGKGLNGVTVSLLKAKDSSLAKAAISDKSGQYEFENIKEGKYLVSFTSVGFEKKTTSVFDLLANGTIQLPAATLQQAAKGLSEVTVQAKRPFVENKIDKMVVNVDGR